MESTGGVRIVGDNRVNFGKSFALPEPAFSSITKGTDISSYLPSSQDQRHLVKVIQNCESDIERPDDGMLLGEREDPGNNPLSQVQGC